MEKGLNVDLIYLDFSKAFDKVDHRIVLSKLAALGVNGKIISVDRIIPNPTRHCKRSSLGTPSTSTRSRDAVSATESFMRGRFWRA